MSREPEPKRTKSDDGVSIIERAAANGYTSLAEVVSDIRAAASTLKEDLNLPTVLKNHFQQISPSDAKLYTSINLFVNKAEDLAQRENAWNAIKQGHPVKAEDTSINLTNGVSKSILPAGVSKVGDGKLVLTLYGGQPGVRDGKQMFSSLQHGASDRNGTITATRPLREVGLPNGITTTEIVSEGAVSEDKAQAKTLGQLFSPSPSLQFTPSKSARSSAKQHTVGWDLPRVSETTRSRNNQSYYQQGVTPGMWLNYSGAQPKSNDPKRKQRERALSLSGVKPSVTDVEADEQEAAELDALFCSAYSSFAPTKDDTMAVVPSGILNQMWWQRAGENAFERLTKNFENVAMVDESRPQEAEASKVEEEAAEFEDAINHWDEVIDPSLLGSSTVEKSAEEKDAEEILEGISELLETLNSYQRNRNLAPPVVPRSGAPSLVGTPNVAQPDEEESRTYSILKSQLSLMISTLPPYAVAKLNSDQLSELNISTKIPVYIEPYKGVLEEDESAVRAKIAQMSSASSSRPAATPTHHRPNPSAQFGNQYNTAPRAPSGTAQYYQNSTPARTPGPTRPPQTAGPVPYNAAPRPLSGQGYRPQPGPGYGSPAAPMQTPRPIPQPQYAQNAAAYYQTPGVQQRYGTNGVPQTAPQPLRYQPPPQSANFQPRPPVPQTNGMPPYNAFANPNNGSITPAQRQPSPVKPLVGALQGAGQGMQAGPTPGFQAHLAAQQQARAQQQQYGTPTPAAQTYYSGGAMGMSAGVPMPPTMQQQIANGGIGGGVGGGLGSAGLSSPGMPPVSGPMDSAMPMTTGAGVPGMPATSGTLGPTGYRTTMSPAEEASLMARQRAMAAMQGPYQVQARTAAQNGAGMTPGPGPSSMSQSPMTPGPMTPQGGNERMGGV